MKILSALRNRLRAVGLVTAAGLFAAGIVFWSGASWVLGHMGTEQFCIGCHEMQATVYQEYRTTVHYANPSGVRATCADCHTPREWDRRLVREIQASSELLHKVLGTIDTPEKFNARRLTLAQIEWDRMKRSDSRECRNCHKDVFMDFAEQGRRGAAQHQQGMAEGQTCIDCHKGIAHRMPAVPQDTSRPQIDASVAPRLN
jgi:cytochrome c-type protein NapC